MRHINNEDREYSEWRTNTRNFGNVDLEEERDDERRNFFNEDERRNFIDFCPINENRFSEIRIRNDTELRMNEMNDRNVDCEIINDRDRRGRNVQLNNDFEIDDLDENVHTFTRGRHGSNFVRGMDEQRVPADDETRQRNLAPRSMSEPPSTSRGFNVTTTAVNATAAQQPRRDGIAQGTNTNSFAAGDTDMRKNNAASPRMSRGFTSTNQYTNRQPQDIYNELLINRTYVPESAIIPVPHNKNTHSQATQHTQPITPPEIDRWRYSTRTDNYRADDDRIQSGYRTSNQMDSSTDTNLPLSQPRTSIATQTISSGHFETYGYGGMEINHAANTIPVQPVAPAVTRANYIALGKYSGTEQLEHFLYRLKICRRQNRWTDEDALNHLSCALKDGAAQLLWESQIDQPQTVEELIQKLRNRYGNQEERFLHHVKLQSTRQRASDDLGSLVQEVRRLATLAFAGSPSSHSEAIAIKAFLDGMYDRKISARVLEHSPTTLDQTYRLAVRFTAYQEAERDSARHEDRNRNRVHTIRETETGFGYNRRQNGEHARGTQDQWSTDRGQTE